MIDLFSIFSGFISSTNITQDRRDHTISYDTPIDCVWTIRAEMGFQIYIQFTEYELQHPNDCHTNYIQVKSKFYKKRGATFFYDITHKLGPLDFTQYRSKSSSF